VAAEIIHDDDVAGFEEWNELLFDIGAEAFAVDWAVEDARRRELVAAQGAEESQRSIFWISEMVCVRSAGFDSLYQ
jgi:hypothetical protein